MSLPRSEVIGLLLLGAHKTMESRGSTHPPTRMICLEGPKRTGENFASSEMAFYGRFAAALLITVHRG